MISGGVLEPTFGISVSKVHDVIGGFHHFFDCSWAYTIISLPIYKVQPPHAEHVVRKDDVFIKELPDVLGVISLPLFPTDAHQFRVCWWYEKFCCKNT